MDAQIERLLKLAFEEAPGIEANTRIQAVRERLGGAKPASSYEVILPEDEGWSWFEAEVVPRMVYHLECMGIRPPEAPGVFLSIFRGERLYFVHARDALALVSELMRLDADALLARFGTGERRTPITPEEHASSGPPLALPGPEPEG